MYARGKNTFQPFVYVTILGSIELDKWFGKK